MWLIPIAVPVVLAIVFLVVLPFVRRGSAGGRPGRSPVPGSD